MTVCSLIRNARDICIVERRVDLIQYEKGRRKIASAIAVSETQIESRPGVAHLWMAKRSARAAIVFSPPESCSMSRNRFIGGIAWYLMP
jgi:hypothetical protein